MGAASHLASGSRADTFLFWLLLCNRSPLPASLERFTSRLNMTPDFKVPIASSALDINTLIISRHRSQRQPAETYNVPQIFTKTYIQLNGVSHYVRTTLMLRISAIRFFSHSVQNHLFSITHVEHVERDSCFSRKR